MLEVCGNSNPARRLDLFFPANSHYSDLSVPLYLITKANFSVWSERSSHAALATVIQPISQGRLEKSHNQTRGRRETCLCYQHQHPSEKALIRLLTIVYLVLFKFVIIRRGGSMVTVILLHWRLTCISLLTNANLHKILIHNFMPLNSNYILLETYDLK